MRISGSEPTASRLRWFVVPFLAICLLLAACAPSDTVSDVETSSGCPTSSDVADTDSTITDLLITALGGAAKGAAKATTNDLFGWALSSIGVGGGNGTAILNQISAELQQIETTLVDICNELEDIHSELQELICANDADWLSANAATDIDSWYSTYLDYVIDTQEGAPPPEATIQAWVNDVLDSDNGTLHALTQLWDLGVQSTSSGSIADCIKSQTTAAGTPDLGTLDDRPYYDAVVARIQNWFYGYNTKGFQLLAEAYHYKAWLAAGAPTGEIASTLPQICNSATDAGKSTATPSPSQSGPSYNCIQAQTIYDNQVLPWITGEIAAGGAPYSTDDYVIANGWASGNGIDWLMPTSIEAYSTAAGGKCASPLESTKLCGPLVIEPIGGEIPSVSYGNYGSDGYGKWVPAVASRFNTILAGYHALSTNDSTTTAAGWLCTGKSGSTKTTDCTVGTKYENTTAAGLENADKIFVFNDRTTNNLGMKGSQGLGVWCFLDGAMTRNHAGQPFCDSEKGTTEYKHLMETHNKSTKPPQCNKDNGIIEWKDAAEWTRSGQNGPVSDTHFYSGTICDQGSTYALYWGANDAPEYSTTESGKSYQWPILVWTDLKCTDALNHNLDGKSADEALNPGGVPTMCGDDYSSWLASQLPPPT